MNDIIREFLVESHESLAQLDRDLVTLERAPDDRDTLARVFRTIHTVKGTAGFLGLAKLQAVGHAGETLLGKVRSGQLAFGPEVATALLGVVDAIRNVLASLEATETEGDGEYSAAIQATERFGAAAKPAAPPKAEPPPAATGPPAPRPQPATTPPAKAPSDPPPRSEAPEPRASSISDSNVRVDVSLLDTLMNLVGELVLTRNQIAQFGMVQTDLGFLGTIQRLNQLTAELQTGVMKTRMQPIANVWAKFPRVVRDLAVACGKQVRLDMAGTDTELDRSIVEAVKDPLTHLVRNAIDHGIEVPAARVARGKAAEGRLLLRAAHEGGKVVIEITDDGSGIDPTKVRDKALAAKLVTAEQVAGMTEAELVDLIFVPGFTTTDHVTHFSGRGVGMDVVRTHVEKIGGTVEVNSRPGHGTTVYMRIPLTLAIVPALLVSAGGDRYAIPQVNLLELVRLEADSAACAVESVHGAPVFRLRGDLLPLVDLAGALRAPPVPAPDGVLNVVVLQADERKFGLLVSHIHDTEEIVVKPLQKPLKGLGVYSGATILGDGRVAMILDVVGLAHREGVIRGSRGRAPGGKPPAPPAPARSQPVLLFELPGGGRMAVPLGRVSRLEEFPLVLVESVGGRDLLQYRGSILPLVHLAPPDEQTVGDAIQIVVLGDGDGRLGLVVRRVIDVVDEDWPARSAPGRPGVLFNAVVHDRITEFLDVDALTGRPASGFVTVPTGAGGGSHA